MKKLLFIPCCCAAMLLMAHEGNGAPCPTSSDNPRDTVVVPEGYKGEDSISYIENATVKSPISAKDLLGLAEVHSMEQQLFLYNNFELLADDLEHADRYIATHGDSVAMRLANRFMRMYHVVDLNGDAKDKLQWAIAVNTAIDNFRKEEPSVPSDSVLDEMTRVIDGFSSQTQYELNFQCYVEATKGYYLTIEAYRNWLNAVPDNLRALAQEEYEAWHDFNEARFAFWHEVSYTQEWYSMKPMEIEGYFENLALNRRAELEIERDIVLKGKAYQQKGKTVTTKQWEAWIKEKSVPEDIEFLGDSGKDLIPSDSLVAERVGTLKSTFSRWLKARQAFAAALPEGRGESYDRLTADIHCRIIGKLKDIIPYGEW